MKQFNGLTFFEIGDRVEPAQGGWSGAGTVGTVAEIVHNPEPGMEAQELCVVAWDDQTQTRNPTGKLRHFAYPHDALALHDPLVIRGSRGWIAPKSGR